MIQTDDLYLGAYGLLRGGELVGVSVRGLGGGRRVAYVQVAGPGMEEALREYYRGSSVVDLRLFKCEVRRLKDAVFEALRRQEGSHADRGPGVAAGRGAGEPAGERRR